MSGTNIFTHVSDEAKYVYLQPFTSSGSAFESGGDVQSIIEQFDASALVPLPILPFATTTEQGSVEYASQAEAIGLEDVLTVLTPHSLDDVNTSVSPATDIQIGNVQEILLSELTRDTSTSNVSDIVSYRRMNDMTSTRHALDDDGTNQSQGFEKFATISESLSMSPELFISPLRTWNLIKQEIPNPWSQASEIESGVLRTVGERDFDKSDKTIAITVGGLNHVGASPSKRGSFQLTFDNLSRDDDTANEYAITPNTIENLLGTPDQHGFFKLPSTFVDEDLQATSAALGFELNKSLGPDGGTITGTLTSDNFITQTTTRVKRQTSSGSSYYSDVVQERNMYPSEQLDSEVGSQGRPVGSVFHTTSSTNPSVHFGGVWYRIQGGRTVIGAGTGNDAYIRRSFSPGTQGGQDAVRLAEAHLPVHKHAQWGEMISTARSNCIRYKVVRNPYGVTYHCKQYATVNYWQFGKTGSRSNIGSGRTDRDNYMYYNEPVGGNGYHENMMPYYSVYIWRRVK